MTNKEESLSRDFVEGGIAGCSGCIGCLIYLFGIFIVIFIIVGCVVLSLDLFGIL